MPIWSTFADPKIDFAFARIFGIETREPLLISLLNDLLELNDDRSICDLTYIPRRQRISLTELRYAIVDAECRDRRGHNFVVKIQLLRRGIREWTHGGPESRPKRRARRRGIDDFVSKGEYHARSYASQK